jgi:hypothetical protein
MLAIDAGEQLFVYQLNRARHDPVAYQQEEALPVDLSYVTPRGPLAVNNNLSNSAEFHATEMAVHNYFGHQSAVTGEWPNQMARDAGYPLDPNFPNNDNYIESIAAGTFYAFPSEPLRDLIIDEGIPSLGHRNHLLGIDQFNAEAREIGVGHALSVNSTYQNYWAIHATRAGPGDRFLTGVVYNDADHNQKFDLNEGLAGVTVTAGGGRVTTTNAAGGWSIKVPSGTYTVMASGASYTGMATAVAAVGGENVEVDFISGQTVGVVNFDGVTPVASVNNIAVNEASGTGVNAVFTVTLAQPTSRAVTVNYATGSGTATADTDFASQSGQISFAPGMVTAQITIAVAGDLLDEPNEHFVLNLTGADHATIDDNQGIAIIVDDDNADPQPNNIFVVAPGAGRPSQVRVLNPTTGAEKFSFLAYPGFQGGAQVATGDVTGDGVLDVIVGAGSGGGPHIRVIDGMTGNQAAGAIGSFFAYTPGFTGGVFVAAADLDGDQRAEIITGAGATGGPHVRIFSGLTGAVINEYFAYDPFFVGGVRVAVGDIDGSGTPDVITAAGAGGGPHVRVFSGASNTPLAGPLGSFFAYDAQFMGGVYVAAGDLNGDNKADIITGPGFGGGPHVRAFSGADGAVLASFFAYTPGFTGGVRVAAADFTGDLRADIITAAGMSGGPHVRVFDGTTGREVLGLMAYELHFTGGVYAAGSAAGMGSIMLRTNGLPAANAIAASPTQSELEVARSAVAAGSGQADSHAAEPTEPLLGPLDQAFDMGPMLSPFATDRRRVMSPDHVDRILALWS